MGKRRVSMKAAVAAIAAAAAAMPAAAAAMPAPLPAKVTVKRQTVKSVIGSYCVTAEKGDAGMCADAIPIRPGPRHRLTVVPQTAVQFRFRDQPRLRDDVVAASGRLMRFDDDGRAAGVGRVDLTKTGRGWRAQLPKRLHRADTLFVSTALDGGGDISHFVGLRSLRRQPLRCPGRAGVPVRARAIRGLDLEAASAVAEARGCTLRVVRIDGVDQVVTEDFSLSRVNVIVRRGLVVGIDGIY